MEVFAAFDFCRSHKNLFLFFIIVAISRKLTNTSKILLNDWLRTHTCPSHQHTCPNHQNPLPMFHQNNLDPLLDTLQ